MEISLLTYNVIRYTENLLLLFLPSQDSFFELPKAKPISHTQTKSGQLSKLPLRYYADMNKDTQVLMANLNEILAVPDWR